MFIVTATCVIGHAFSTCENPLFFFSFFFFNVRIRLSARRWLMHVARMLLCVPRIKWKEKKKNFFESRINMCVNLRLFDETSGRFVRRLFGRQKWNSKIVWYDLKEKKKNLLKIFDCHSIYPVVTGKLIQMFFEEQLHESSIYEYLNKRKKKKKRKRQKNEIKFCDFSEKSQY